MAQTSEKIEKLALGDIIAGFNKQSVAMPSIAMRFLELEGIFTDKNAEEALSLYRDIMESKISGKDITVCQLAAYYLLAELTIQRNMQLSAPEKRELTGYV